MVGVGGGGPAVWIGDRLTLEAQAWADERAPATLLIDADPGTGLTRPMVDEAPSWAATHREYQPA